MGSFLAALTQTVLISALPSIMKDFHVSANTGQSLTTIYMLVLGVMIPATPYLINRFPTRKLFISSMVFFLLGCVLSIVAANFQMMVLSRILQAVCSGINMQLVQILMMTMYPVKESGRAMGIYGFIIGVAPAIGPTLAGIVIDSLGWKSLFYFLGAISFFDIIMALIFLKNIGETKDDKLDIISLTLSTLGFGGLLIGISDKGSYSWSNPLTYIPILIGILSLILFTIRQLKLEKPLLNLRVFKSKIFAVSVVLIVIIYASMTSSSTMIALYIQSFRGYDALKSGLVMLPGSVLMAILSPIAGRLFDIYGPKKVVIPGFIFLALGTFAFSFLGSNTSIFYITFVYAFRMVGISFLLMTVTTWGINTLTISDIPSGSAIGSTLRQVSGSIGSAVLMAIMSSVAARNPEHLPSSLANIKGMDVSFFLSGILVILGLALALMFMNENAKSKDTKKNNIA